MKNICLELCEEFLFKIYLSNTNLSTNFTTLNLCSIIFPNFTHIFVGLLLCEISLKLQVIPYPQMQPTNHFSKHFENWQIIAHIIQGYHCDINLYSNIFLLLI